MKAIRFALPAACLATVLAVSVAQKSGDPFAVGPDRLEKIAEALPDKTPAPVKKKHEVLVFSRTAGFRHSSIPVGVECMKQLGAKTGLFNATHTEDPGAVTAGNLSKYDAVILLNTTGDAFNDKTEKERERLPADVLKELRAIEEPRKAALLDFVKSGKGLIGIHSATDTYKEWKEFNEMMGGAFVSHPWGAGDTVRVRNLDPKHPLNAAFNGDGLTIQDEIYKFRSGTADPAGRRMLLALDANGTNLMKDDRNEDGKPDYDFYPIAWLSKYGEGRTFYCSLGHNDHVYWTKPVVQHYLAGIQYALGELPADATPQKVAMLMSDGSLVAQK